ncbi:MAG: hypothetical protein ACHQE6_04850 [Solirubrobacterales bacterium]
MRAERVAATKSPEAPAKPAAGASAKPTASTRAGQAANGATKPTTKRRVKSAADAPPRRAGKTRPGLAEPPVPPQGFEAEETIEPGRAVAPPRGPELAVSVAELLGELAQAGLATGGRLLSDALKRLPGA